MIACRWIICLVLSGGLGLEANAAQNAPAIEQPAAAAAPGLSPPMDRASAERLFAAWKAPVPPRHLLGNVYYVGAIGVSSFLITTPEGHILLDTGFEDTVPVIVRGVEQLGFKLADIKLLLSSHAHVDHVGGHARLRQLTGATVVASAADARIMASGGVDDFIPFPRDLIVYPPVKADRLIANGEQVTLGGVTLTAHLTPGHTRGATTWTMDLKDEGQIRHVVFFSSATISPGTSLWRSPPYPELADDFERTFARLKSLPCDVFFAPHGGQFAMAEKFARLERGEPNPFVDPAGWKAVIAAQEKAFRDQLAAEQIVTERSVPAVVRDVPFATVDGHELKLDLYRPPNRPPSGLIVWVHGGAWRGGSRENVDLVRMTEYGWAVASVDYRLSGAAKFPAQVHDIKAAVRFLRTHAARYGYPPEPFVIAGSSAGGHLAALVGVSNGVVELEGSVGDHTQTSSSVQAIVDLYGASNLTTILAQSTPHGLDVRKPALDLLLGGPPGDLPDLARLASPFFFVDALDPPLLLLHGDQDPQMPINQAHELHGAYKKNGLPVEFIVLHGSGHGGPAFTTEDSLKQIDAFLRARFR